MKTVIESVLAIIHIMFGFMAILNNNFIFAIISVLFLVAALKVADCDVYIVRDYENNKATKI